MTSKPSRQDRTERAVSRAISRLSGAPSSHRWDVAAWTRAVKRALTKEGTRQGCSVHAAGVRSADPEWLYDLCWLKYDRKNFLRRMTLVLECEWHPRGVEDDFLKLVVARAEHRVIVFTPYARASAIESASALMKNAHRFQGSRVGDRYLFGYWDEERFRFQWVCYVVSAVTGQEHR